MGGGGGGGEGPWHQPQISPVTKDTCVSIFVYLEMYHSPIFKGRGGGEIWATASSLRPALLH